MIYGNLLILQKFVVLHLNWFKKLVLINRINLNMAFRKMIIDRLN